VGITYTADGLHLVFSQDGGYGPAFVAIASVDPVTGLLTDQAHVGVSLDVNDGGYLTTVTCFPILRHAPLGQPSGDHRQHRNPLRPDRLGCVRRRATAYPTGIAISPDGKTAYVVLDNNDTLTKIDLTQAKPTEGPEVRVGNVPHSVVISPDGTTAYVSNEGRTNCYREGLPGILERHPGRGRQSDWGHVHRHRFRGEPVHVQSHQEHHDRSAPDGHGVLRNQPAGRRCL
jgi:DNA-binding beta-propeller fold protein YncE